MLQHHDYAKDVVLTKDQEEKLTAVNNTHTQVRSVLVYLKKITWTMVLKL